jgi:hypothetical protein
MAKATEAQPLRPAAVGDAVGTTSEASPSADFPAGRHRLLQHVHHLLEEERHGAVPHVL